MDSDFMTAPLPTDIHALAAMLPSGKPPDPTALDILQPLLEVCGTDWIREFLFTDDPVHIPPLTSDNKSTNAFIVDMNVARVAPTVPQPDPATLYGENQAFVGRYVFVPAFTVHHSTVGVGVLDATETRDSPWLPKDQSSMKVRLDLRFVHDASKRSLFSVVDLPEQDCVAVHCCCVDPFVGAYFLRAMFNRTKLRAVVRGARWNFDCTAILPALYSFIHTAHNRACSKCGSTSPCLCYYACVIPPTHPFDLQHFKTAMTEECGVYRGITNMLMFDNGRVVGKVRIGGSYALVQGAFDLASLHNLSDWSLSQHARKVVQDPRQSLSLLNERQLGLVEASGQGAQGTIVDFVGEAVPPDFWPETSMLDDLMTPSRLPPNLSQGQETSFVGISVPESTDCFEVFVRTDGEARQAENAGNRSARKPTGDGLDGDSDWWAHRFDADSAQALLAASREDLSAAPIGTSKQVPDRIPSVQEAQEPATLKQSSGTVAEDGETSVDATTNLAWWNQSQPSSTSDEHVDVRALMKKMRDEDRKERNRASARRCNERNRLHREEVQKELSRNRETIRILRSEENALRRENLELRKSLKEPR